MSKDKKDRPAATYDGLPAAGSAGPNLVRSVHAWWVAAAGRTGIDTTGLDPDVPLVERAARAQSALRVAVTAGPADQLGGRPVGGGGQPLDVLS